MNVTYIMKEKILLVSILYKQPHGFLTCMCIKAMEIIQTAID